jgi:hypothetical protein
MSNIEFDQDASMTPRYATGSSSTGQSSGGTSQSDSALIRWLVGRGIFKTDATANAVVIGFIVVSFIITGYVMYTYVLK